MFMFHVKHVSGGPDVSRETHAGSVIRVKHEVNVPWHAES